MKSHLLLTYGFIFSTMLGAIAQATMPPDYIYKPNIKSAEIQNSATNLKQQLSGNDILPPIIELNSGSLKISFDDLEQGTGSYSYTVVHCTYDWKPSDLLWMQYMRGFETFEIFDYRFSANTRQQYTSYSFTFPNANMGPLISGNYLLKVFVTGDPEDVVFTRRFMVVEQRVPIDAKVRYASDVSNRNTHQEVYFSLNTKMVQIQDVMNDLKVVVTQNTRWDNAIYDLQPQFVSNGKLDYNYASGENTFIAGNQWRFLDIKTLQLVMEPIINIDFRQGAYHVQLRGDLLRTYQNFRMTPDINGKYVAYNQDTYGTMIDPDYAYVYFSIPMEQPLENGDVYLIGGFTYGELLDSYRMKYNQEYRAYELTTQLKQGYYNYMYAFKKRGQSMGDVTPLEGSFAEVDNDYTIAVYLRQPGDITHKLVGVSTINSLIAR